MKIETEEEYDIAVKRANILFNKDVLSSDEEHELDALVEAVFEYQSISDAKDLGLE